MKLMAYFLVACLMSLSSLSGMANSMHASTKDDCCEKLVCKDGQNQKQKNNCDNGLCNRMLSCSRCGFFTAKSVLVLEQFVRIVKRSTFHATIEMTSDYPETGWHPPKV